MKDKAGVGRAETLREWGRQMIKEANLLPASNLDPLCLEFERKESSELSLCFKNQCPFI